MIEHLIKLLVKGGPIALVAYGVLIEQRLEVLDVIRAEGDVATLLLKLLDNFLRECVL